MKILLSAYACEPNRGSEPGIGWNWALELARLGHEVHVLTRANNEGVLSSNPEAQELPNLHFIYFDHKGLSFRLKKKLGFIGVYWYYRNWQKAVYPFIKAKLDLSSFDVVHHITFGVHRIPSHLWKLPLPFVFGPLGGGEHATEALTKSIPFKARIAERLRDFSNFLARQNKSLYRCFEHAELIFSRTEDTRQEVPQKFREKCFNHVDIGIHLRDRSPEPQRIEGKEHIKLLFVGRILYWKGIHLALRAFKLAREQYPHLSFSLIGSGKNKAALQSYATELGVGSGVEWIENIPQNEVFEKYKDHDLFLFPSLHDSGGSVVLEAMSYGLPVIALDLGGPGVMVDEQSGSLVKVEGKSVDKIVEDLAQEILDLIQNPEIYAAKSEQTCERITSYTWENQVRTLYEKLRTVLPKPQEVS
ncbi:MAG: glycosyltransferase family 4 protein [Bacteroidia bacterium]|nr:glycosyltransferase family 4 protein [Bacteroidia bacterium]